MEEQIAFNDFNKALTNFLSQKGLMAGKIWRRVQKQEIVNQHLALEGKLKGTDQLVTYGVSINRLPLTTSAVLLCFVLAAPHVKPVGPSRPDKSSNQPKARRTDCSLQPAPQSMYAPRR